MSFNLGIELDGERVRAAVERGGTMRMVLFGSERSIPLAVHVGRDGSIVVGSAALANAATDTPGLVADLLEWFDVPKSVVLNGYAITGESLLAHVFAFVLDAARAQANGEPLGHVVVSHPPGWSPARRAALRAAVVQAGAVEVDTAPAPRAVERAPDNARHLPEQAAVLGATALAAHRSRGSQPSGPLTSASAGPSNGRAPSRPAPPRPAASPTSVFDATDPSSSRPALTGADRGGGRGGDGGPPTAGDGTGPSRLPFVVAGGVLVLLLIVLGFVWMSRDDHTSNASSTGASGTGSTVATSSVVGSTTAAPTTSLTPSTTSSSTTTSTSRPSSTTSAATTSTTIVAPSSIGPIALADTGLVVQFGSANSFTVRFGDDAEGTLTQLRAVIGEPKSDTGWRTVELCSGDETRRVVFGDLEVVFTKNAAGAPTGSRTFQQWFVNEPGKKPDGLVTLDRIGIGSTVADLRKVYGDELKIVQPIAGDPSGLFTTSSSSAFLDGITTGTTAKSYVRQMWSGTACQRVAD